MQKIKKISLLICIICAINSGIEGIFEVDVLSRMLVNFSIVLRLFKTCCLFASAVLLLLLFESDQ